LTASAMRSTLNGGHHCDSSDLIILNGRGRAPWVSCRGRSSLSPAAAQE
jgi:hypothetical protein